MAAMAAACPQAQPKASLLAGLFRWTLYTSKRLQAHTCGAWCMFAAPPNHGRGAAACAGRGVCSWGALGEGIMNGLTGIKQAWGEGWKVTHFMQGEGSGER